MPEVKRVIFVCVGNSCRSQIAEGLTRHYAQEWDISVSVSSGGTRPEGFVNPQAIAVMSEVGIDISSQTSDPVDSHALLGFDAVISMGCSDKDICPVNFHGITEDWDIEDPMGKSIQFFRETRSKIETNVKVLLQRFV